MTDQRRVRQDLDLVIVREAPGESTPVPLTGRIVAYEDGQWVLGVPDGGRWVELIGDRWSSGRAVTMLLLRVGTSST